MKTVTMDIQEYDADMQSTYQEGFDNAVRDISAVISGFINNGATDHVQFCKDVRINSELHRGVVLLLAEIEELNYV